MNQENRGTHSVVAGAQQTEIAVLAGGCFWGVEEILRDVPGVIDTDVGYTGGCVENPTYEDTHDSKSGHAEAIRVTFDPRCSATRTCWSSGSSSCTTRPRSTARATTSAPSTARRSSPRRPEQKSRGGAGQGAGRGVRQVEAAHHDDHRARLHLVQRRELSPGLPAQAPRRVHLPLYEGVTQQDRSIPPRSPVEILVPSSSQSPRSQP